MFKTFLHYVRQPETQPILWRWPLPFWLTVSYIVATLTSLLMVTTWREDSLDNPEAISLIVAGIIGGLFTIWAIIQNMRSAIIDEREKSSKRAATLSIARLLNLNESRSRPLWIGWLVALAIVIILDALALILGRPETSYPVGLDRIQGATWTTWLLAATLFIVVRPLAEELIFRGILYPVLARSLGDNLRAAMGAAALFTILYLVQVFNTDLGWDVTYWGLIYPFVLGTTAGLLRAHTKSTWSAVGAHAMFGLFLILSALVTLVE